MMFVATTNAARVATRRAIPRFSAEAHRRTFVSQPLFKHSSVKWFGAAAAVALVASSAFIRTDVRIHAEAPQAQAATQTHDPNVRLDPATSQPLPIVLPTPQTALPKGCERLVLVGLGVRTVSFLSIRVYVAGLYVDEKALKRLSSSSSSPPKSMESLLSAILDQGVACVVRIVPVRSTDYNHLRDGFTRAVQGRAKLARKANALSAEADEALNTSLQHLKEAFPRASLPKGHALDLVFTPAAAGGAGTDLTLEAGGEKLGAVQAPANADRQYTLARQLLLAYMADKDEISKPFKQSVIEGFERKFY